MELLAVTWGQITSTAGSLGLTAEKVQASIA
jgi:hypothetical protein